MRALTSLLVLGALFGSTLAHANSQNAPAPGLSHAPGRGNYHVHGVGHLVEFPGFVSDPDLRTLLHRASAVVIPSLYEPFGIVALEALASGAPLVAAATGGLVEILQGTGAAQLYPAGDVDALVHHLRRVVTDTTSAARAQSAGAALVRDHYSWDAIAAATLPVYERASARTAAAP